MKTKHLSLSLGGTATEARSHSHRHTHPYTQLSVIRHVLLESIDITTKGRVSLTGTPQRPLEDVEMRGVRVRVTGFEDLEGVSKLRGSDEVCVCVCVCVLMCLCVCKAESLSFSLSLYV